MSKDKRHYIEAIIHVFIWSMYIFLMTYGLGTFWDQYEHHYLYMMVYLLPVVFYLNALVLIPRFLSKKLWVKYLMFGLATVVVVEVARAGVAAYFETDGFLTHFSLNPFHSRVLTSNVFLGFLLSTAYKFTKDWIVNLTVIDRLKAENLTRELAFLKAQIDPHFLFNTLNSLYALALEENSAKTADGIIKLSTLMRYNLHDSQAAMIPLNKEIDYIEKYIALQRLRTSSRNSVEFQVQLGNKELEIAPMLLIPFVENAFKYSLNPIESAFIRISIAVNGNDLTLKSSNSISQSTNRVKSGIGLSNVRNRLELLYEGAYSLSTSTNHQEYHVELQINLAK